MTAAEEQESTVHTRTAVVASRVGLHARPAALFARAAAATGLPVTVATDGKDPVDARSVLGLMNRHLTGVETLFLPGAPGQVYVSSSLVKEVARGGGDVTAFLPPSVHTRLLDRLA